MRAAPRVKKNSPDVTRAPGWISVRRDVSVSQGGRMTPDSLGPFRPRSQRTGLPRGGAIAPNASVQWAEQAELR
jgi:hypothetical protein